MKTKTFLALNKLRAILRPDFLSSNYGRAKGNIEVSGMSFSNRLGLGSGIDINGDYINSLSELDFSHLCIGPTTLNPQENDPSVSSKGIRYVISRLHNCWKIKLIALDLTSCADSTGDDEKTIKDFIDTFELSYDFADFFILDFSVPYLRNIIDPHFLISIIDPVLETRLSYEKYRPVFVKLDTRNEEMLKTMANYCRMSGIDGLVLEKEEAVSYVSKLTDNRLPVIFSGHIEDGETAARLISSGASLIHISHDLPSKGRKLISNILKSIEQ